MKYSEPLKIIYKDPKDLVWNDAGSGGDQDGSFWTVKENIGDFKLLGDTACGQPDDLSSPCVRTILVEDNGNNPILSKPTDSTYVWTDEDSGAKRSVKIWRLIPQKGYNCLGDVAVGDVNQKPDLDRYRCVRHDYVDEAHLQGVIWDDKGSGSYQDFTAYSVQASQKTVSTGLFHGFQNYNHETNLKTIVHALIRSKTEVVIEEI